MPEKRLFVLSLLSIVMLSASVCSVFAKAPDTPKIIFGTHRKEEGNRELYLMNPDRTEQVNITNSRADDISGTLSPTGEQILFASDRDRGEGWDLYLMDADGKNVQPVFEKSEDRRHPEWSPDGKQIAYKRFDGGVGYIYIATSDGKNEERLAIGGDPKWSPDRTEIAYVVRVAPEILNIYILNVRTRKQKHFFLPDDISTAREPAWSPDGKALIYSQDIGRWEIHVFKIMLAEGTSERLTDVGFWNKPGDWFDPAFALPVSPQPRLLTTTWGKLKKE